MPDAAIPRAFDAVKDSDEEILWVGRPAFLPFLVRGVPFLAIGLLWGAIDYFGFIRGMSSEMKGFAIPFFALHLFPFYMSILNMVRLFLVHGNTCYAFTNKRLMLRTGFWGTDFRGVDYDKIEDLEVNVNPVENVFGVGTVLAYSGRTNAKGREVREGFIAISNPYDVYRRIKEVCVDIKTDWNYPNDMRPDSNPGYRTTYQPRAR